MFSRRRREQQPDRRYTHSLEDPEVERTEPSTEQQSRKFSGQMGKAEDLIKDSSLSSAEKRIAAEALIEKTRELLAADNGNTMYSGELNYWNYTAAIAILQMYLGEEPISTEFEWIRQYVDEG